jgi:hypothetical protein
MELPKTLEITHDQNTGPLDAIRGKGVWRVVGSLWEAPLLPDELKRSSFVMHSLAVRSIDTNKNNKN